jgi:hypothetical protein
VRAWGILSLAIGCSPYVRPLPPLRPIDRERRLAFGASARAAVLTEVLFALPGDYVLGQQSAFGCRRKWKLTLKNAHLDMTGRDYQELFAAGMLDYGYPVNQAPDLLVNARVVDLIFNYCTPDVMNDEYRKVGNAYLRVEWTVVARNGGKVLYREFTEGETPQEINTPVGTPGILRPAFSDAVHRLATSEGYRAVIASPVLPRLITMSERK